jgi:hypothetical protein
MYYSIPWMDLSISQQRDILHKMVQSFEKPWHDDIPQRFFRPSCRVELDVQSGVWQAASISWKYPSFRYLDKFFVHPDHRNRKGVGREWLAEWIHHTSPTTTWVWRTNSSLATGFYGKNPAVVTHGISGDYVYQGVNQIQWEAEDIEPLLRLTSCFHRTGNNQRQEPKPC